MSEPSSATAMTSTSTSTNDSRCSSPRRAEDEENSDSDSSSSSSSSNSSGSSSSSSSNKSDSSSNESNSDSSSEDDGSTSVAKPVTNQIHTNSETDANNKTTPLKTNCGTPKNQNKTKINNVIKKTTEKTKSSSKKLPSKLHKDSSTECSVSINDLRPIEMEIYKAIGKIKRQKQRASVERLTSALKTLKGQYSEFETSAGTELVLKNAIDRGLLQIAVADNGEVSYREMGAGTAIVAQIARRKNAAQLADNFALPAELQADLVNLTATPEKAPKEKQSERSKQKENKISSKTIKKESLPLSKKTTPSKPLAKRKSQDDEVTLSTKKKRQPSITNENHVDSIISSLTSPQKRLVCMMCKKSSSKDELITCTTCENSGELSYLPSCYLFNMNFCSISLIYIG